MESLIFTKGRAVLGFQFWVNPYVFDVVRLPRFFGHIFLYFLPMASEILITSGVTRVLEGSV